MVGSRTDTFRLDMPGRRAAGHPTCSHSSGTSPNSNLKDHHGRFAKGSIKVLGQKKINLALAFFIFAVNTRAIL